ncbi:hypothetical protein CRM22_005848 [Opisthorchis felineus]|uniref:AH domain-containing protein n=1 Tax=Opisthorchis felineus TaxID=147828 RepID=A0A4S2LWF9_OPIFE|nr:hypothetical protein CRM22_005848 [Opisthorchis felineus]TGZ65488.1 hypothetical protein CRM22_005848 [Opisthorchis felineus]TGZ65489.1 hypothetical protein CRM22_005848 [Opisthorchis felineus]TGZ65490.1 hypothetical protein CRM22_005848 [Opisthorchis felineus]
MSNDSCSPNTTGFQPVLHSSKDVFAETSNSNFYPDQCLPPVPNGEVVEEAHQKAVYDVPNSSPPQAGHNERPHLYRKLDSIKNWSVNTFKCTKQIIEEKIGAATPTCDEKLDLRIETLRQMQRQYRTLLDDARRFSLSLAKTVQIQREFAGHLAHVGQQQPELTAEFACNAELQKAATTNGEKLLCVFEAFCGGLSTLVNQTFEDIMLTIRNMNAARVEFDAYRKEAESIRLTSKKSNQSDAVIQRRLDEALTRFQISEENFLDMKAAVDVKMRLLHENRVRVMQHNLSLLNNATSAYFSGDVDKLDLTLRQFNVKIMSPHTVTSRWSKKQPTRSDSLDHPSQSISAPKSPAGNSNLSGISNGSRSTLH